MTPPILRLDHVQVAMPPGGEAAARAFYGELLEMEELEKPPVLAARGGCWFASGAAVVHVGVEEDFRPARKAHPAFVVQNLGATVARLAAAGIAFTEADEIPEVVRGHVADPFGNRVELIEA